MATQNFRARIIRYVEIPVGRKNVALIDEEDLVLVKQYRWQIARRGQALYAVTPAYKDPCPCCGHRKRTSLYMHRLLLSPGPDAVVDHINGDGLDNRRENLQIITVAQNMYKAQGFGKLGWKNVYGKKGSYFVQFRKSGKDYRLGPFSNLEEAIEERNRLAKELFGEYALIIGMR